MYHMHGRYIRYKKEGLYWEFVNSTISSSALLSFFDTKSDFIAVYEPRDDDLKSEWSHNLEEFFRQDEILSLRAYNYIGFAGGMGPTYFITTLNFGGNELGQITIQNLLSNDEEAAARVLAYCARVIEAALVAEGVDIAADGGFFENYDGEAENVWKIIAQFNFDKRGLTINISPYDVLPRVLGSHEVYVPWELVEGAINDRYAPMIARVRN
jgi:hypothetical protein